MYLPLCSNYVLIKIIQCIKMCLPGYSAILEDKDSANYASNYVLMKILTSPSSSHILDTQTKPARVRLPNFLDPDMLA